MTLYREKYCEIYFCCFISVVLFAFLWYDGLFVSYLYIKVTFLKSQISLFIQWASLRCQAISTMPWKWVSCMYGEHKEKKSWETRQLCENS